MKKKKSRSSQKSASIGFPVRFLLVLAGVVIIIILACNQFLMLRSSDGDRDEQVRNLQQEVADLKRKNALLTTEVAEVRKKDGLLAMRLERAASEPVKTPKHFLAQTEQQQHSAPTQACQQWTHLPGQYLSEYTSVGNSCYERSVAESLCLETEDCNGINKQHDECGGSRFTLRKGTTGKTDTAGGYNADNMESYLLDRFCQVPPQPATASGGNPIAPASSDVGFREESIPTLKSLAERDAVGVMLIVCKRPQLFQQAIDSVLKADRDPQKFPIIISQDDFDQAMTRVVEDEYVRTGLAFHMHHAHDPQARSVARKFGGTKTTLGYVYIAQHYGYIMKTMFEEIGFNQLIFLEEDLQVSPDFFSYFGAMLPILRADKDLYCVSAWNDNGAEKLVKSPEELFRTDFFPGLGWMMEKSMWNEVRDRWASAFWDEFMRRKDVRKDRRCIRPEISRTYTGGYQKGQGTSGGQFKDHLKGIMLNTVPVNWAQKDVDFLSSTWKFEHFLRERLRAAREIKYTDDVLAMASSPHDELRIAYEDKPDVWETINEGAACETNSEGIKKMMGKAGHKLDTCKALCSSTVNCMAIDYFKSTKWCNLFNAACKNPQRIADGSSSYRRQVEPNADPPYRLLAKHFFLMPDEKEGIRRMSYRGVIPFVWQDRHVFLYTRNWPEGLKG
mmetsp:Transcript_28540/g.52383  ORF Transcript_28540/g.52383 Transcript_28540/m.52383 type:complete len:673 (-) Transcript_28540:48-2066(-)